ncbi:MAG TPA: MarR family transcriptional regulator [Eubacteriaceae bacterium]|nr:MarR family transcriptional regulator [Eubacteriaceae bacterium]
MDEIKGVLNNTLVLLFNLVLKAEEKFLREIGCKDLSMNEIHVIEAVGKEEKRTMGNVAKELNVTLGTLTASVSNLEKKNYVQRVRSEKDRRVVHIELLEKGKKVDAMHKEFHDNMINEIIENLNETEEKALIKGLNNLVDYFIENYNN